MQPYNLQTESFANVTIKVSNLTKPAGVDTQVGYIYSGRSDTPLTAEKRPIYLLDGRRDELPYLDYTNPDAPVAPIPVSAAKVTFLDENGDVIKNIIVDLETTVPASDIPVITDTEGSYHWALVSGGESSVDLYEYVITEETVFHLVWDERGE